MPCTMPTLHFNRTKQNERLREIGDTLTHELDKIREAILAGETPDFSADTLDWHNVLNEAESSRSNERSGPSDGVLTDVNLLNEVTVLHGRYVFYKNAWRQGLGVDLMKNAEKEQINHRKEDLKRLAHTFIETGDMPMLRKVIDADPAYPLTEQLGFDPDDY